MAASWQQHPGFSPSSCEPSVPWHKDSNDPELVEPGSKKKSKRLQEMLNIPTCPAGGWHFCGTSVCPCVQLGSVSRLRDGMWQGLTWQKDQSGKLVQSKGLFQTQGACRAWGSSSGENLPRRRPFWALGFSLFYYYSWGEPEAVKMWALNSGHLWKAK